MTDTIKLPAPYATAAVWLSGNGGIDWREWYDADDAMPTQWDYEPPTLTLNVYAEPEVRRLIAEAVAAEREACAQIVEDIVRMVDGADAVAAIRARNGSTT